MPTLFKTAVESTIHDHLNTRKLIYIIICLLVSRKQGKVRLVDKSHCSHRA